MFQAVLQLSWRSSARQMRQRRPACPATATRRCSPATLYACGYELRGGRRGILRVAWGWRYQMGLRAVQAEKVHSCKIIKGDIFIRFLAAGRTREEDWLKVSSCVWRARRTKELACAARTPRRSTVWCTECVHGSAVLSAPRKRPSQFSARLSGAAPAAPHHGDWRAGRAGEARRIATRRRQVHVRVCRGCSVRAWAQGVRALPHVRLSGRLAGFTASTGHSWLAHTPCGASFLRLDRCMCPCAGAECDATRHPLHLPRLPFPPRRSPLPAWPVAFSWAFRHGRAIRAHP